MNEYSLWKYYFQTQWQKKHSKQVWSVRHKKNSAAKSVNVYAGSWERPRAKESRQRPKDHNAFVYALALIKESPWEGQWEEHHIVGLETCEGRHVQKSIGHGVGFQVDSDEMQQIHVGIFWFCTQLTQHCIQLSWRHGHAVLDYNTRLAILQNVLPYIHVRKCTCYFYVYIDHFQCLAFFA